MHCIDAERAAQSEGAMLWAEARRAAMGAAQIKSRHALCCKRGAKGWHDALRLRKGQR